jgi:hypothetical protein
MRSMQQGIVVVGAAGSNLKFFYCYSHGYVQHS